MPALDSSLLNTNSDLNPTGLIRADGIGTPKFKDEDSLTLSLGGSNKFYVRKRLQIQARKEMFAMENYRSETAGAHAPQTLKRDSN